MTSAVTPGLGWPASDRYPGGPDVPSAPSDLGWPAPRPAAPPAPRPPAEAPGEPVPPEHAEHAAGAATEEAPAGGAGPVAEIPPTTAEPGAPATEPASAAQHAEPAQAAPAAESAAHPQAATASEAVAAAESVEAPPAAETPQPRPTASVVEPQDEERAVTEPADEPDAPAAPDAATAQPAEAAESIPAAEDPLAAAGLPDSAEPASGTAEEPTPATVPPVAATEEVVAEAPAVTDSPADQADGNASAAYRESLVRDAMARVASPNPPPDVSRETWHDAAAAGHTVPDVSRETEAEPASDLAAFIGEDTPIAAAAAAAIRSTRAEPFPKPAQPRILTVANQKGGVGKTTTTVNIAAGLALRGLEVLVIDLDPQGNASTALGISHTEGTASVYDVLVADKPMDSVVQETAIPGLFCAPATVDLAGAEIELVPVVAREGRLKRALASYKRSFDYVFIDCPPSLGLLTVNALVAANEIVIPIQCEFYALEGLGQLLRNVELIRSHLNADLWVSTILLTMYDSRTKLADQVASEVRGHFGDLVLDSAIPRSVRISEAPGYGQTVLTYDPASRGAQAYLAAAREMAERGARMTEGS